MRKWLLKLFFFFLLSLSASSQVLSAEVVLSEAEMQALEQWVADAKTAAQQQSEDLMKLTQQLNESRKEIERQQNALSRWKICSVALGGAAVTGLIIILARR